MEERQLVCRNEKCNKPIPEGSFCSEACRNVYWGEQPTSTKKPRPQNLKEMQERLKQMAELVKERKERQLRLERVSK